MGNDPQPAPRPQWGQQYGGQYDSSQGGQWSGQVSVSATISDFHLLPVGSGFLKPLNVWDPSLAFQFGTDRTVSAQVGFSWFKTNWALFAGGIDLAIMTSLQAQAGPDKTSTSLSWNFVQGQANANLVGSSALYLFVTVPVYHRWDAQGNHYFGVQPGFGLGGSWDFVPKGGGH